MTAQQAVYRSERLARRPEVEQIFLLHMLTTYLCNDERFCHVVDEWLDAADAAAVVAAAAVEAELAAPPCVLCGGHVGHSLTCLRLVAVAAAS